MDWKSLLKKVGIAVLTAVLAWLSGQSISTEKQLNEIQTLLAKENNYTIYVKEFL